MDSQKMQKNTKIHYGKTRGKIEDSNDPCKIQGKGDRGPVVVKHTLGRTQFLSAGGRVGDRVRVGAPKTQEILGTPLTLSLSLANSV